MRLYYDPITHDALHTYDGPDELAPSQGSYIDVAKQTFPTFAGLKVVGGAPVYSDLTSIKAAAIGRVNRDAGELRRTFITTIPGQEMLYLAKETEARDWIADAAPSLGNYPLLSAEAGLTAPDADQLAQLWLNLGGQWRQVAAQIEAARLGAVYGIEAATSEAEIAAIEKTYVEALP